MKTKYIKFLEGVTPEGIHNVNAIWNGKHYEHFGIHRMTASLFGDNPDDIVKQLQVFITVRDVHIPILTEIVNEAIRLIAVFSNTEITFKATRMATAHAEALEFIEYVEDMYATNDGEFDPLKESKKVNYDNIALNP